MGIAIGGTAIGGTATTGMVVGVIADAMASGTAQRSRSSRRQRDGLTRHEQFVQGGPDARPETAPDGKSTATGLFFWGLETPQHGAMTAQSFDKDRAVSRRQRLKEIDHSLLQPGAQGDIRLADR